MKEGGQSTSLWMNGRDTRPYPPLSTDVRVDVCIVGAGIAGTSVAYHLVRAGRSVMILDDGPIGGGETGRTTAHLANAIDDRYTEIERLHGRDGARLAAESHTAAIARIEQIVADEGLSCDFERVNGYLFISKHEASDALDRELEAAHRAGLHAVSRLPKAPWPEFETGPCLLFPDQAQFHPLHYLAGLARAIESGGGRIHTGTHIISIAGGAPARVEAEGGHIVTAEAVVVATNTPVNDMVAIHTKQAAYRTYVIGARIRRGSIPTGLYWDMEDPYHYVRLQPLDADWDMLLVGGEDHKTGQAEDMSERHDRLASWARARFPIGAIEYEWSGQVMEPIDGLGLIGRNPGDAPNVYIATGDSGMGMTHGTIAGMLIADLIVGRRNDWERLYDPSRTTLRAVSDFARENLNAAAQYTDWVTGGDVKSPEEIQPDSGAVVRRGLTKVAVYRDPHGALHERSAVCPHLGCIVGWNGGEKTWDCPCHGSRFNPYGTVLNGPALSDLPAVEAEHGAQARR